MDPIEIELAEVRDVAVDDPGFELLISIPRLVGLGDAGVAGEINRYLLDLVTRNEQAFVRDVTIYLEEAGEVEGPISFLDLYYDVRTLTPDLLSMRFDSVSYFQGAANPGQGVETLNFDLQTGEMVFLEDLFIGSEWAFALDFLVRDAVITQLYNGEAGELDAWVDPDEVLVPEDFALGPGGFEFSFPELTVAPAVAGSPTVIVPYSAIGVYLDPGGYVGRVAAAATATCTALDAFDTAIEATFTAEIGSAEREAALDTVGPVANDLRRLRPDLNGPVDVLAGWATAFVRDPATELTEAERDAIEASNDILRFEFDLCG